MAKQLEAIAGNQHFVWVSEVDGEVVGAVCAMSEDRSGMSASNRVMLYYRSQAKALSCCESFLGGSSQDPSSKSL